MIFSEIKTFTYIGNSVSVDGEDFEVSTGLNSTIEAVQYHSGRDYLLEEIGGAMTEVSFDKYQYALDEWTAAKDLQDNPPAPTAEEQAKIDLDNKIATYKSYLDSTDKKVIPYYEFEVSDLTIEEYVAERKVARDFIRANEVK